MAFATQMPSRFVVWAINENTLDEYPVVTCVTYTEAELWITVNRRKKGEHYRIRKTPVAQLVPYTTFRN